MRFRKPYTLICRRGVKGKRTYYYRVRDPETGRKREYSTHLKSKQAAEHFCEVLRQEGRLVPSSTPRSRYTRNSVPSSFLVGGYQDLEALVANPAMSFGRFAEHWWGPECPYCASEARRGKVLSRTYVELCRLRLTKQILPTFGETPLQDVGVAAIERWMEGIPGGPRVKNTALQTFRTMLGEALRLDLITSNPAKKVKPFKEEHKTRVLFTSDELSKLFDERLWLNARVQYLACLTARWTAMRAGEILGAQVGAIFEESGSSWINVELSWDRQALKGTKGGKPRMAPLPREVAAKLRNLPWKSGFMFSSDRGKTPIQYKDLRAALMKALTAIGIPRTEQVRRGLGLHAFRHSYNTKFRSVVDDNHLRAVVGHVDQTMTDHYTHDSPETLRTVADAVQKMFDEETGHGGL